jgi:hypothetical protein
LIRQKKHVPEANGVVTLRVLFPDQRLEIAAELPEVPTLVDELMNFWMKPVLPSTEPLAAWREGPQDRMIVALAVATWWIERVMKRLRR